MDRLIRFPVGDSLPSLLAMALQRTPADRRLLALQAAMNAVQSFEETNRVVEATYHSACTELDGMEIRTLSPLEADRCAARRQIQAIFENNELSGPIQEWLRGERRAVPGAWNNGLAVAVVIQWNGHRLLFPSDLDVVPNEHRGWRGLLARLGEDQMIDLVQDLHVVKVAHLGSDGAWFEDAWDEHARSRPVRAAVICPWRRGSGHLPDHEVLERLQRRTDVLALTHDEPMGRGATWPTPVGTRGEGAPAVALTVHASGEVHLHTTGTAGAFRAEVSSASR